MGRRHQEEIAVGEDSFMDTIANLVGIMIILVVIVSARGYATAKVQAQAQVESEIKELETPKDRTVVLERDLESQLMDLRKYDVELAMRSAERMSMVDRLHLVEQALDEHLREVDDGVAEDVSTVAEISELERQLQDLLKQSGDLPAGEVQPVALQHLPTPMAKTVFGKELHVMLSNQRVTVIPWDSLIESLKNQVQRTVERNTQKERIDDTLGPIDGFVMHYRLLSRSGLMSNGRTAAMGRMVELDKFELEPTQEILAETVEESLRIGGRLRAELESSRSQQTTVTVWVYPDSFATFRALKEKLFKDGFLCAARPLPSSMRIGASPRGSSSAAQ